MKGMMTELTSSSKEKSPVKGVVELNTKDKVKGIQDDAVFYTQDDIQSIRLHRTMYISSDQTDGAMHLFKEVLANAIDEANNDNPHWNKNKKLIDITYSQPDRRITIRDNGRGIPADILVDGPFVESLKNLTLKFRGSSNQRLLHLHAS